MSGYFHSKISCRDSLEFVGVRELGRDEVEMNVFLVKTYFFVCMC